VRGTENKREQDQVREEREKERERGERMSSKDKRAHQVHPEKVTIKAKGVTYVTHKIVGQGSFGVVYQATVDGGKEVVAIKKVLQDKRFKNRELQIMRALSHPNVCSLKNSFYTSDESVEEVHLNLVLEYVPDNVYRVARQYSKMKQPMSLIYVKLYMYQLLRALGYVHALGICHRDIKPQNLLLDPQTSVLKLCDFGSAKVLTKGNPNVSYICSRYYRAPELIFGATSYTTAIDLWSTGCVMAELLLGHPLFPGESGVDQLVEIIKVLGTPTKEQIRCMNPNYNDFKFPQIKPHPWHKVFRPRTSAEAVDLVSKLLQYDPTARIPALQACAHPFFDKLRDPNVRLPNGRSVPPLFNFTQKELDEAKGFDADLLPPHILSKLRKEKEEETEGGDDSSDSSDQEKTDENEHQNEKEPCEENP